MEIIWSFPAERDREEIWRYLQEYDPVAADRIDDLFDEAAERLLDYPLIGHVGLMPNTRELTPHRNYRMIYKVDGETIWIVAVVHAMRAWPPE